MSRWPGLLPLPTREKHFKACRLRSASSPASSRRVTPMRNSSVPRWICHSHIHVTKSRQFHWSRRCVTKRARERARARLFARFSRFRSLSLRSPCGSGELAGGQRTKACNSCDVWARPRWRPLPSSTIARRTSRQIGSRGAQDRFSGVLWPRMDYQWRTGQVGGALCV
jgi:hypothetical protein